MNDPIRYLITVNSLSVFGKFKEDPVISCLCRLLGELSKKTEERDPVKLVGLYSDVTGALYPTMSDLSRYIRSAVISDDNFYIEAIACGDALSEEIHSAVKTELNSLEELAAIDCGGIIEEISVSAEDNLQEAIKSLPGWTNTPLHLLEDFSKKISNLDTTGYGIFAEHEFFRISEGSITPVPRPDVQPLSELFGYERQRKQIIKNTEALLGMSPGSERDLHPSASNMLLYGDAGTGKSSTVKAVAKEYANRGLRLIEIKKDQLTQIPSVLEAISKQPLRFILFIDDLSFTGSDDNFSTLKATLEGSVVTRRDNAVIYATSNRRHLIRESFSDRRGDDLHLNDTLQETMSLAARFGLTVIFERPDKDEYLDIVLKLAKLNGISLPEDELIKKAEAHAIRRNGRSPRTARQLIELIKAGLL